MFSADHALLESLAGQAVARRQPANEMVRRPGDKIAPGIDREGFSTFTTGSKGEDEGTAFKAKTADGKVVPIIMRGIAGQAGSAEVIVPGHKRVGLSIAQASKLRGIISMYDLADVKGLVDAIRKNKPLPGQRVAESAEQTSNTPGGKPIVWGGSLLKPGSGTQVDRDPFTSQRGHWLYTDQDGHHAIGLTSSQYQGPSTGNVYQMEIHWAGGKQPGPGVKAEFWFAARKPSGTFMSALSKRFSNFDALSEYWFKMYKGAFKEKVTEATEAPGEKITIYSKAAVGITKEEGYLVGANASMVMYRPRRGRRTRAIMSYYSPWWMVVKGWSQPEPGEPWKNKKTVGGVTTSQAKYRSTDERWVSDFMAGPGKGLKPLALLQDKAYRAYGNVPDVPQAAFEALDSLALAGMLEVSPPGWAGSVKAMKRHMSDGKAFALAWSMHKKGATPHYKDSGSSTSDGEPVKKKRFRGESMGARAIREEEDEDLTFIADPKAMQRAIADKLGLANMRCSSDVLDVITSMYDEGDVPAAVYAAAMGMSKAEQNASAASAKALNQLSAADVAAALIKGVQATGSTAIKDLERWWTTEIGKFDKDRGAPAGNNIGAGEEDDVQPYIDSLSIDEAFEGAAEEEDDLPIGSGALSSYEVIGLESGYRVPGQMRADDDLSRQRSVDRAAAAAAIHDGVQQVNSTAKVDRNMPDLPGMSGRIRPGSYTAESLDELDYGTRLRLAEAYDKYMGNAPDLSHDELVDAEAYKALLVARSTPQGTSTEIGAVIPLGKVTVDDVDVDDAFDEAANDM